MLFWAYVALREYIFACIFPRQATSHPDDPTQLSGTAKFVWNGFVQFPIVNDIIG